ncbi:hypothetical protein EDC04DRAFT_3094490 [Pisolithus marmoratus]|nr:hypothetical protein EDC04DRAFT_3094490 [Pisolithus marmoratus]
MVRKEIGTITENLAQGDGLRSSSEIFATTEALFICKQLGRMVTAPGCKMIMLFFYAEKSSKKEERAPAAAYGYSSSRDKENTQNFALYPKIYEKPFYFGRFENQQDDPTIHAALLTKRNLVLVCKQWQHMAMRYLYCHLFIRTVRELLALRRTLRTYATENSSSPGTQSPGQWARRLDITWNFFDDFEFEDPDSCIEILADVIKCLPKLEIVSFAMSGSLGSEPISMPLSVLDALRRSANSLRILDWSGDDLFPQLHQLEELLRDLPELVWADGIIPSSILSSLTTLAVERLVPRDGHPGEGSIPEACVSLREFIFRDGNADFMQQFIIRYGKYLTTTKCYNSSFRIAKDLGLLHKSCPNLNHLFLYLDRLIFDDPYPPEEWSFPHVEFLGVALGPPTLTYQDLFRFLAYLRKAVPTLRVFQLLSPLSVKQLLRCSFEVSTEHIMKKLHRGPFRVEDDEGNLLSGGSTPAMNGSRASAPSHIFTDGVDAGLSCRDIEVLSIVSSKLHPHDVRWEYMFPGTPSM